MFDIGNVLVSALAKKKAKSLEIDLMTVLQNYSACNWPDLSRIEKQLNELAAANKRPIYARYKIKGEVFIVTTNLNHEVTQIYMVGEE